MVGCYPLRLRQQSGQGSRALMALPIPVKN